MNKTFAPGKDAALEDTISKINLLLKQQGFEIKEVSWMNPLPNVWSVIVRDKNRPYLFSNGKGTCRNAALASALGEFVERLATGFFFFEYYLGDKEVYQPNEKFFPLESKKFLSEKLWEFYDPDEELKPENLIDINSGNPDRGIRCLPFKSLETGETIYFPVNILDNLYLSNGMAAGNSEPEAQSQALSEIIERYVKFKIISEGISLPEIPEKILNKYSKVIAAREKLKESGYEILIKDASLNGEFPVINITLLNSKKGTCLAAFGAHPRFEVALERTLTELFQGRSLDQLGEFQPPSFDIRAVSDYTNLEEHFIDSGGIISWKFFNKNSDYNFQNWNLEVTTKDEVEYLENIINKLGFNVYRADYNCGGMHVCRFVIPGMSEIYPVDDLMWNNKNEGVFFRDDILNLKKLDSIQRNNLLHKIEKANLNSNQYVDEFIGTIPENHSGETNFNVGELKILLALSIQNYQQALDYFYEGFSTEQFDEKKKIKYNCLKSMLEMKFMPEYIIQDYKDALLKLYNRNNFDFCVNAISGKNCFETFYKQN